jgi:hypothetical protein
MSEVVLFSVLCFLSIVLYVGQGVTRYDSYSLYHL